MKNLSFGAVFVYMALNSLYSIKYVLFGNDRKAHIKKTLKKLVYEP